MKVTNTLLLSKLAVVLAANNHRQIPTLKGAQPAAVVNNYNLLYDSNRENAATSDIVSQEPSSMPSISWPIPVMPWSQFTLDRTLIELPDQPETQFFWHCLGGSWNVRSRMSVFTPRVTRYIDVSTWDDPPRDWNGTINANVTQTVDINGVNGNGIACICQVFNLDFGQWLSANAAAQSSIAIDTFQSQESTPSNWWNTDYLSPDANTQMLEQVYEGEPLFSSSYGFVQPAILTPTEPSLVTNNKFLRVEGASPSEGILLRASSEGDYGLEIYRVEESSSVDWVRTRPIYSGQADGRDIHLNPVPEGHFYTIVIQNPGETGFDLYDFDSQPPYHCVFNENGFGLKTRFDVTFTTTTSSTYNASSKTNVGFSILLAATTSIATSMLVSF